MFDVYVDIVGDDDTVDVDVDVDVDFLMLIKLMLLLGCSLSLFSVCSVLSYPDDSLPPSLLTLTPLVLPAILLCS